MSYVGVRGFATAHRYPRDMEFVTEAELDVSEIRAIGAPVLSGIALVFTADDAEHTLASLEDEWRTHIPSIDFWRREAPNATWFGAFTAAEHGHIATPPPHHGDGVALVVAGHRYPGVVLNETGGARLPAYERFLIAGRGNVPIPPTEIEPAA